MAVNKRAGRISVTTIYQFSNPFDAPPSPQFLPVVGGSLEQWGNRVQVYRTNAAITMN